MINNEDYATTQVILGLLLYECGVSLEPRKVPPEMVVVYPPFIRIKSSISIDEI